VLSSRSAHTPWTQLDAQQGETNHGQYGREIGERSVAVGRSRCTVGVAVHGSSWQMF
jgi:hypothetical protein